MVTFWASWKNMTFKEKRSTVHFLGNFNTNLCYFSFQHLVTLHGSEMLRLRINILSRQRQIFKPTKYLLKCILTKWSKCEKQICSKVTYKVQNKQHFFLKKWAIIFVFLIHIWRNRSTNWATTTAPKQTTLRPTWSKTLLDVIFGVFNVFEEN